MRKVRRYRSGAEIHFLPGRRPMRRPPRLDPLPRLPRQHPAGAGTAPHDAPVVLASRALARRGPGRRRWRGRWLRVHPGQRRNRQGDDLPDVAGTASAAPVVVGGSLRHETPPVRTPIAPGPRLDPGREQPASRSSFSPGQGGETGGRRSSMASDRIIRNGDFRTGDRPPPLPQPPSPGPGDAVGPSRQRVARAPLGRRPGGLAKTYEEVLASASLPVAEGADERPPPRKQGWGDGDRSSFSPAPRRGD